MASRYRRFIKKALTEPELCRIADALTRGGFPASVCGREAQPGEETPYRYVVCKGVELSVRTDQDLHWITTGQQNALDSQIDGVFYALIAQTGACTCSHCYAHFSDDELSLAWDPQGSASCERSFERTHPAEYQQYLQRATQEAHAA